MQKRKYIVLGLFALAASTVLASEAVKELVLPEQLIELTDWFLANKAVSIVKYAAIVTMVVQVIKSAAMLFGHKLPASVTAGVVALVGFLGLVERVLSDGVISGGDWSALLVSLTGTVGAFFGYKVLFSSEAKVNK